MKKLLASIGMWLAGTAADFWTSALPFQPDFPESNAFWRHANGSIWPMHALVHCLFQTVDLCFMSVAGYIVGRCFGPKTALAGACAPWLYLACGHFSAAIGNYMIHLKLYVELM